MQLAHREQNQQWAELHGWASYAGETTVASGRLTLASAAPVDALIDNFTTFELDEEPVAGKKSLHDSKNNERFAGDKLKLLIQEDESLSLDLGMTDYPEEPSSPAPSGPASNKPLDAAKRKQNLASDAEQLFSLSDATPSNGEMFLDGGLLGKDQKRFNAFYDSDGDGLVENEYFDSRGAYGGGIGGQFGVEFKYDGRHYGRVDYTQWYRQLFPEVPVQLPAKQPAVHSTEPWPAEATALAKQLLRNEALRKLGKGLTIKRTEEEFDTVWKRRSSHHESLVLVSAGKWLTKPLDPGTHCVIQTYDGKARAAYTRALLLGQTRPAIAADQVPNLNLEDFCN
ncbi:MAG: hypothetical protein QM811_03465 [Pirellulales bacterium]